MVLEREATQAGETLCHCNNRDPTCFLMRYKNVGNSPVVEQWLCRVCAVVVILQPTFFVLDHVEYVGELD